MKPVTRSGWANFETRAWATLIPGPVAAPPDLSPPPEGPAGAAMSSSEQATRVVAAHSSTISLRAKRLECGAMQLPDRPISFPIPLGVLDQSPIRKGGTPREALLATISLAQEVERLGYSRYWVAEHHNSRTLASASPEILIPTIAGATERIRVGSGGVMLTHYAALKVAEQFRLIEALYPGRIDLGLGRAPGSDRLTAAALHHGPGALPLEAYPDQVVDVLRFMTGEVPVEHPFHGIRATPAGPSVPEPWLLGSAYDSARYAAELGLGFAFAQFISPDGGQRIVREYRDHFQPSPYFAEPRVILGVSAICAETDEAAHRIALSRHLMRLRREQGRPDGGVPSIEEAEATEFSKHELDYLEYQRSLSLQGSPARVRQGLLDLAAEYQADELMIVTVTHSYDDRKQSYELIAKAFAEA